LMTFLLKSFGHTPVVARDGVEGLALARREPLDLIICDVQMPAMDGYEVARRLKSDPRLRQIPLVAVTALAMVGDRDKMLAAGFDGYIAKPIAPRTFVKEVETYLNLEPQPPPRPAKQTPEAPPVVAKRGIILAVDNSPVNLTLAHSILEPFGYEVITAANMTEGLRLARQFRPDLILSDLHMPGGSGLDFIQAVKADARLKHIPFVFISSTVYLESDRHAGLALGAVRFICRPIKPQALLAEIEACLGEQGDQEARKPGDHGP